jgi:peptide methionine sulfoxide reductase msrA/msrB
MSDTNAKHSTAMIAGGCFWCVEADLKKLTGVHEVVSGYAGGDTKSPTYENYAAGGHREVVLVTYDAQQVSFRQLIIYAVKHMDPTDGAGSFGDRGKGYAPALYYSTATEKQIIEKVIEEIDNTAVYKAPLAVEVLEQPQFWPAESYHQGYHTGASSLQYRMYRKASGRDAFINEHWKNETGTTLPSDTATSDTKPTEEELQKMLTPLQFEVTQKAQSTVDRCAH